MALVILRVAFTERDAVAKVFEAGHRAVSSASPFALGVSLRLVPASLSRRHEERELHAAKLLANLSSTPTSFFSVSAVISFLLGDLAQDAGVLLAQQAQQLLLELLHGRDRDRIEIAARAGEDHRHLLLDLERRELRLLQELGQAGAARQQPLRHGVEVGAELGEGRHLAVLRQLALDACRPPASWP